MTMAHAKLKLEETATIEDAVQAIYLYEESAALTHGRLQVLLYIEKPGSMLIQ